MQLFDPGVAIRCHFTLDIIQNMQCPPVARRNHSLKIWSAFLLCWAGLIWRLRMPHIGLQARGPLVWVEIVFLLLLYGYVLLSAYGLGQLCLRLFKLPLLSKIESGLLALMVGFGIFSMGITIIGLIGWLNVPGILTWLAISGSIAFRELIELVNDPATTIEASCSPVRRSRFEVLLQTVIFISIPLLLVNAASPVWDYDALMYHMEIPRQFLAEGRIYFDPEIWRSAYPFLGEMPFLVGMIFGLDPLAKLINLTYAVLLMSSVYVFSVRFWGR
ncbi:MAG: hypothetical protein JW730_00055 [Anaerolineales bacterium]|nr:hypothetical protein [Anaerolineales bacterium]